MFQKSARSCWSYLQSAKPAPRFESTNTEFERTGLNWRLVAIETMCRLLDYLRKAGEGAIYPSFLAMSTKLWRSHMNLFLIARFSASEDVGAKFQSSWPRNFVLYIFLYFHNLFYIFWFFYLCAYGYLFKTNFKKQLHSD